MLQRECRSHGLPDRFDDAGRPVRGETYVAITICGRSGCDLGFSLDFRLPHKCASPWGRHICSGGPKCLEVFESHRGYGGSKFLAVERQSLRK